MKGSSVRSAALLLAAAALGACISVDVGGRKGESAPEDRLHLVETPAPAAASAGDGALGVVAVREFHAADRLEKRVLRISGPGRVVPLDHDFWSDEPSRAVGEGVRELLAADPRFEAAVDASSAVRTAWTLDGHLLRFALESASSGPAGAQRALLRLRLTWSDAATGSVVLSRVEEVREDLPGPGTDGLGQAMGRALAKAVRSGADAFAAAAK